MARRKRPSYDMLPGLFDTLPEEGNPTPTVIPSPNNARQRQLSGGMAGLRTNEPSAPLEPLAVPDKDVAMKFISFGSGSSGNCYYLGDDKFGILIDAGVDPSKIYPELQRNGIPMTSIGGIILTHDHGDHIRYAYTIVRKYRHIRIYCTPKTLNGILRRHNVSRRIKDFHQPIFKEFQFHVGSFTITPFEVMHDGSDNCGFFISLGGHNFVVATDMGSVTERADHYMRLANHLMIESNYDMSMLLSGRYPEYLKARILAADGHMDNLTTANYLAKIVTPALHNVFLCHLSHDNNTPEIAINATSTALRNRGINVGDGSGSYTSLEADIQVMALPRFDSTGVLVLK